MRVGNGLETDVNASKPDSGTGETAPALPIYPCTVGQRLIWFLHVMDRSDDSHHECMDYILRGRLHKDALEKAFQELVQCHESLRATFFEKDGRLYQRVHPYAGFRMEEADVEHLPLADRSGAVRQMATAFLRRPFHLEAEFPFRVMLIRQEDDLHALVMVMHHIQCDGSSMVRLLVQLSAQYNAYCQKGTGIPFALPVQSGYWGIEEQQYHASPAAEKDAEYWVRSLRKMQSNVTWPFGKKATGGMMPIRELDEYVFSLDASLVGSVASFSREHGQTFFRFMLSTYYILLNRHSSTRSMTIGIPVAFRHKPEYEDLIGMRMKILPLTVEVDGGMTFLGFIQAVNQEFSLAFDHSGFHYVSAVDKLQRSQPMQVNTMLQTYFNYKDEPRYFLKLAGLEAEKMSIHVLRAKNDFSIFLERIDLNSGLRDIRVVIQYDKLIFTGDEMKLLAERWKWLIRQCIDRPDIPIGQLDILTPVEQQVVLHEWNDTSRVLAPPVLLHELFAQQAAAHHERPAVLSDLGSLTYGELDRLSDAIAHGIAEKGMVPGQVMAIHMRRSIELVAAMIAVLKSGGAFLNIDPDLPDERKRFMLSDACVRIVISGRDVPDTDLSPFDIITIDAASIKGMPVPLTVTAPTHAGPDSPAYVIYTSGSTGQPKGVVIPHRGIVNLVLHSREMYGYGPDDRTLQKAPLSFDVSVLEVFLPLVSGGAVVLAGQERILLPQTLVDLMARFRVTDVEFVASMLREIVEVEDVERLNAHLRTIRCGGESMDRPLLQRCRDLFTARIVHDYGPAETAVTVCSWDADPEYEGDRLPIGKPYANTRIHILNEFRRPVPPGVVGEVYIGGAQVGSGYLNRPETTRERFLPDPVDASSGIGFYRTGDLARYLEDGNIIFVGRNDDQVKINGQRVEPEEVAAALRTCRGVRNVAVLSEKGAAGAQVLVAYLEIDGPLFENVNGLRSELASQIPAYMIPSRFHEVSHIPLTGHGKMDLQALRQMERRVLGQDAVHEPPVTRTEEQVADIWCELLGLERVGREDDFFHLGGHSLHLISILNGVRAKYGVEVDLRKFYGSSRLRDMALMIEESRSLPSNTDQTLIIEPIPIWEESGSQHVYITIGGDGRMSGFTKYRKMGQWLNGPCKMYALPDPEALSGKVPGIPLEELARKYAQAILRHQPDGPYILLGECIGGIDAFAIGCALQEVTDAKVMLFMLDTAGPDPEKDEEGHDQPKVSHPLTFIQTRGNAEGDPLLPMIFQKTRHWLMKIRKFPAEIQPGTFQFKRMKKLAIEHQLFDEEVYLKQYPVVAESGCDPFFFHMNSGWREGLSPSSSFSNVLYAQIIPGFDSRVENPILHFLNTGILDKRIRKSVGKLSSLDALLNEIVIKYKLLDKAWYLENNPDVEVSGTDPLYHYIHWGYLEKRDPSPIFNRRSYRLICPYYDIDQQNPILHFVLTGIDDPLLEKRVLMMTNTDLRFPIFDLLDNNVHVHHSITNIDELLTLPSELERAISTYQLFDANWYLEKFPDVRAAGMDPLWHYLMWGCMGSRDPAPYFNSTLYKLICPDFRIREENPILHFVLSGIKDPEVEKKVRSLYISGEQKSRIIAFGLFDADWSAKVYPSPAYYGKDPFIYQHTMGWRMGRKPFDSFDESSYAAAHPDFIPGSTNPVMHMLQHLPGLQPVQQEKKRPLAIQKHLEGKTVKTDRAENSEEIEAARVFLRKKAYKPGVFRGEVHMIVSFPNNVFNPTMGWDEYIHGRIIPISAHGDHLSSVWEDWRKNADLIGGKIAEV